MGDKFKKLEMQKNVLSFQKLTHLIGDLFCFGLNPRRAPGARAVVLHSKVLYNTLLSTGGNKFEKRSLTEYLIGKQFFEILK